MTPRPRQLKDAMHTTMRTDMKEAEFLAKLLHSVNFCVPFEPTVEEREMAARLWVHVDGKLRRRSTYTTEKPVGPNGSNRDYP